MADLATLFGRLQYGASRYEKPQEPLWHWGLVMVARDGIEPPTRGFSVPCFALCISELRGRVTK